MTDPIGREIIEALGVTELPKTLRGKLTKTVLRLIAGGPGFKYLDQIRHNENTLAGREKIDLIVAEEVARQAIADPDYMERAKARFLGDMVKKQENVEAVARKASEEILELSDADALSENEDEPSDDWMNAFTREAELASSDELRARLARILAMETQKPGSISRSTVRAISELEKETLLHFRKILEYNFGDFVLKGKKWEEGVLFQRGMILQSEGLISGSAFTTMTLNIGEHGVAVMAGRGRALFFHGTKNSATKVPVYALTRIGKEIAELLGVEPQAAALQEIVDELDKNIFDAITLVDIVSSVGGKAPPPKILFERERAEKS